MSRAPHQERAAYKRIDFSTHKKHAHDAAVPNTSRPSSSVPSSAHTMLCTRNPASILQPWITIAALLCVFVCVYVFVPSYEIDSGILLRVVPYSRDVSARELCLCVRVVLSLDEPYDVPFVMCSRLCLCDPICRQYARAQVPDTLFMCERASACIAVCYPSIHSWHGQHNTHFLCVKVILHCSKLPLSPGGRALFRAILSARNGIHFAANKCGSQPVIQSDYEHTLE